VSQQRLCTRGTPTRSANANVNRDRRAASVGEPTKAAGAASAKRKETKAGAKSSPSALTQKPRPEAAAMCDCARSKRQNEAQESAACEAQAHATRAPKELAPGPKRRVATTRQPERGHEICEARQPSSPKKTNIGRGVATWRAAAEAARRPAICEEREGAEKGETPPRADEHTG